MFEVDEVLVVFENFNVGKGAPGVLNFFSCTLIFRLLSYLATTFLKAAPRPLDLNGCDMVHCKSVILEETPCQRHFVGRLNEASAEVSHRNIFALGHVVERRGEELLA